MPMRPLGADYPVTVKTPLGPVTATLSVPLDQMAQDAINATWPHLQAKLTSEAPKFIAQLAPAVQRQLPGLLEAIRPDVERQREAIVGDVRKTALGLGLVLTAAVLVGAVWVGRRR